MLSSSCIGEEVRSEGLYSSSIVQRLLHVDFVFFIFVVNRETLSGINAIADVVRLVLKFLVVFFFIFGIERLDRHFLVNPGGTDKPRNRLLDERVIGIKLGCDQFLVLPVDR